jgi:hypothetical protein
MTACVVGVIVSSPFKVWVYGFIMVGQY